MNCSIVTLSFSQFKMVAFSILPLFALAQADKKTKEQRAKSKYLFIKSHLIIFSGPL